jgi:hypothetical protein
MTFNRTAACLFSTFHNLTFRIVDQPESERFLPGKMARCSLG